jgi:hypothetical protein
VRFALGWLKVVHRIFLFVQFESIQTQQSRMWQQALAFNKLITPIDRSKTLKLELQAFSFLDRHLPLRLAIGLILPLFPARSEAR